MKKAKKCAAYIFYVLALIIFFLYLCFPAGSVKRYAEYRAGRIAPGMQVSIEDLGLGFPPAMVMENLGMQYKDMGSFDFDTLVLEPDYLSLFGKKRALFFQGKTSGGEVHGSLAAKHLLANQRGVSIHMDFSGIRIEELNLENLAGKNSIAGILEGKLAYTGDMRNKGKGEAGLKAGKCEIRLNPPFFGIKKLEFKQAEADLEIENSVLEIKRFSLDGTQFSGKGSGNIRLAKSVEKSRISFSAEIVLHPALLKTAGGMLPKQYRAGGKLPVRIKGTLANPEIFLE